MIPFESSVKLIPHNQEHVYAKLSDLNNLESIKDKIPLDKVNNLSVDAGTLSLQVAPVGNLTLQIIERDPPKCIKFETVHSPLFFHMWIQLSSVSEESCKLKLTLHADVNMFMKNFIQKPLQEKLEKIAEMMAKIPY